MYVKSNANIQGCWQCAEVAYNAFYKYSLEVIVRKQHSDLDQGSVGRGLFIYIYVNNYICMYEYIYID